jgi:hypothetical protein
MNFGDCDLGDPRRTRRLVQVAQAMAENPHMRLPKQLPDWSDLTGAYRLLSNPNVDPQQILAPHRSLTRQEALGHPVVLCVQDDTQLDFTCRSGMKGLGTTGDGLGRGLLQHSALAVLPGKRLLGVLHLAWHAPGKRDPKETRRTRQARWNASDVWQEAALAIGMWPAGSQLIHVGDRQADLFRFLRQAADLGHGFVVRAQHDRHVDDAALRLWAKLEAQAPLGTLQVTLGTQRNKGNRIKRAGREASLTIRVAPVAVPPPRNDPRSKDSQPLEVWAIYLKEEHPPQDAEPVEWMLISSLEAVSLEQALVIVGYYTCRWVIEEWHRCLKEGCGIEKSQLDEAADIQRLGAIMALLAARLLQMRDLAQGKETCDSPEALESQVPAMYRMIVAGLAKVQPDRLTPHVFWRTIAKRGGWLARKHDHPPGWIVLWRGWSDLVQMVRGAELYQQLATGERRCV